MTRSKAGSEAGQKRRGIQVLIFDNLEEGRSEGAIIRKLIRRFGLEPGQTKAYYEKYAASTCSES